MSRVRPVAYEKTPRDRFLFRRKLHQLSIQYHWFHFVQFSAELLIDRHRQVAEHGEGLRSDPKDFWGFIGISGLG
jgi:hypothetical protein